MTVMKVVEKNGSGGDDEDEVVVELQYLVRRPPPQAIWCEGVEAKHLHSSLYAQVVQDAANFQRQQVLLGQEVNQSGLDTFSSAHCPLTQFLPSAWGLTTVRKCRTRPSTRASSKWLLYCGRPMSSSHPATQQCHL